MPPRPQSVFTIEYAERVLAYWRAVATVPSCAVLGKEALKALSIPISQAVVERSFSMLSAMSNENRLLAGASYVANIMILAGNYDYLWPQVQSRARVLGMKG